MVANLISMVVNAMKKWGTITDKQQQNQMRGKVFGGTRCVIWKPRVWWPERFVNRFFTPPFSPCVRISFSLSFIKRTPTSKLSCSKSAFQKNKKQHAHSFSLSISGSVHGSPPPSHLIREHISPVFWQILIHSALSPTLRLVVVEWMNDLYF